MIFKFIKKAVKFVTAPLRKVLGWLFKIPGQQDPAAVLVEKQGSDHAIPVVYGTRKIGVIKVHKYVTDLSGGAENELLHLICVLCEGEIDAIEEVYFDGVSENDVRWRKDKNNANSAKWFTVNRYLGAANQVASAPAVAAIPNWTNNHKLSGLAYLYVVLQMDKDQSIWRGEPEITARVRGRKIYDPRSNTTAYSVNPSIQLLDYLQNTVYGKGLNQSRLSLSSFIDAANFADETLNSTVIVNGVTTPFTHKRFSSNQVVDTGNSVFGNVQQMLSAMRGSLPIGSGALRLQIERDTTPTFYFSHGRSELLNHATITGKIKSSGGNKKDRFNRVVVRFPNAALDFERDEVFYPDSEDPQFTEWLAEDNGVLLEQSFEFNTITNKAEALQMARIITLRSRFQLQCSFVASPAAIVVEPGDVTAITDDTRGWDAKPFRVEQVKLKDDGDVELEFIEHQNAIYPWSGATYTERTGGTNLGDPTNIPAPTGLSIAPDLTLATGGRLTWSTVNNAFIRRFRVQMQNGSTLLFSEETAGRSLDLPLLAPGSYTISVFAISTLNTLSPAAVIAFEITLPVAPTSIQLTSFNFEIEARPVLAGTGLGTQFEFDIVEGNGIGHTPTSKARGGSATFVGLKHNTQYTVFARTINALGNSGWVNASISTTNDANNVIDLIKDPLWESTFQPVVIDLQQQITDVENQLSNTERELKVRIQAEQLSRQASDKQLFDTAAAAVRLRQDVQLGITELKDATFEVDPANGQVRLRALAYTDNSFSQASFLIDGVNANVNILAQRVTSTEDQITQATGEIDVLAGQITLRATYTEVNQAIAGAIDAILPAYSFGFFNSAEGWAAVNGTLTSAGGKVTLTLGDIANTALSFIADENPVISISLERTAGSGWQGDLIVTFDGGSTVTYVGVIDPVGSSVTVRNLNLAGEASYTGTITGLRLVLGQTIADEFTVNSITIGKPSAALTEIEGLTAQVNQLGINIDAVQGQLTSYVTSVFYSNNSVTFSNAAQVIDGTASVISLKATQQQLDQQGTVTKANSASQWVNAAEANITQVVTSYNAQPGGIDDQLDNAQQTLTTVNTSLDALNGRLSDQIVSIANNRLKTNDVSKLQFFAEYELYKQRNNQLDQGSAVAIAERDLISLANSQQALSQELLTLEASFGAQTGQINASLNQVNQTIANETLARAESINSLSAATNDQFAATAGLIQQVQTDVEGNAQSITGISNRVGGLETFSQAQLILNSQYNQDLDQLESRAFLGVTNVVNGVATIAGLTIGGGNNAINFQGDVFGLTNTAGVPVLYWTNNSGVLNIRARLVLSDNTTVNTIEDIRALDGADGLPGQNGAGFYGSTYTAISWTTSTANQRFTELTGRSPVAFDILTQTRADGTDSQARQYNGSSWVTVALQVNGSIIASGTIAGNRLIAGTSISAPVITGGKFVTDSGTGIRIDTGDDGTYLQWAGANQKNDANATFYIKRNGDAYYAGELRDGVSTAGNYAVLQNLTQLDDNVETTIATAVMNAITGKPVTIQAIVEGSTERPEVGGNGALTSIRVRRNGVLIGTKNIAGFISNYEAIRFYLDNVPAGTYTYTLTVQASNDDQSITPEGSRRVFYAALAVQQLRR
ncbi:phage tail protein [Alishewanella sp. 16-MA]|uniref:Phage tail protein n=1 Tax=Alishewanella maricola TaxID=2795740 RepID=A0ABS8C1L8_9ALTE|nr:phage tail protein [Alishewanella maricola]MCB5226193.1 phage tail protein [Alishewanella maricola]